MMDGIGNMMSGPGMAGMWSPLFLWVVSLALVAWVVAKKTSRREEQPVVARVSSIEGVLRERLARGDISVREFEDALRQLRDS